MNIKGNGNKIDRKQESLKIELSKPVKKQNIAKIKRLKESIKRNKDIQRRISKKRRIMNQW